MGSTRTQSTSWDGFYIRKEARSHFTTQFTVNLQRDGRIEGRHVYGKLPFDEFPALEQPSGHEPGRSDVDIVRDVLCSKGLPDELVLDIMEFPDYTPAQRLNVSGDPFHPSSRDELHQYLKYCWQLLVRRDMIAKEVGRSIGGQRSPNVWTSSGIEEGSVGRTGLAENVEEWWKWCAAMVQIIPIIHGSSDDRPLLRGHQHRRGGRIRRWRDELESVYACHAYALNLRAIFHFFVSSVLLDGS